MNTKIECCGITFEVFYTGTEYRPATYFEPAEGGELEMEEIFIEGVEVSEVISDSVLEMIRSKLEASLDEDLQSAAEDAAEGRAFDADNF